MAVQVPTEPADAHASQVPSQAVSQQTPSAQWPVAQSPSALQLEPWATGWQVPELQAPVLHAVVEAPQLASQSPVLVLHAWSGWQSLASPQPQVPPARQMPLAQSPLPRQPSP